MKGFTLIELMIVMTISVVLLGGSIAAYLNFNKTQTTSNDARALTAELYRVRTLASSLQYPTGCVSLKGYNVSSSLVGNDLSGVTVVADCEPVDVPSEQIQILSNSVFNTPFNLTFLPGSGYLNDGLEKEITITNINDPLLVKVIRVGVYGQVSNN